MQPALPSTLQMPSVRSAPSQPEVGGSGGVGCGVELTVGMNEIKLGCKLDVSPGFWSGSNPPINEAPTSLIKHQSTAPQPVTAGLYSAPFRRTRAR